MPSIFETLGIDPQDAKWYHLAACSNMPINWFYDDYESDKNVANQVDQICLHCPVIDICYEEGIRNKERGVWGGVFLDLGRPEKTINAHKDAKHWKKLKRLHGKD